MNPRDQKLANLAFAGGPAALLDSGMNPAQVQAFIARPDVAQHITALLGELDAHEGLMARQKFLARRSLARLAPQAVQTLADAMNGVVYARDAAGKIKTEAKVVVLPGGFRTKKKVPIVLTLPPDEDQVTAAQDILDRIGVVEKATVEQGGSTTIVNLFGAIQKEGTEIGYADAATEQKKVLTRESARIAIEQLMGLVPKALEQFNAPAKKKAKKVSVKVKESSNGNGKV